MKAEKSKSEKTVGIKELKNCLSHYLKELKKHHRILVTDRGKVVAELVEPQDELEWWEKDLEIQSWIAEGSLRPPLSKKRVLPVYHPPVRLPEGTALKLLDEDRGS